MRFFFIAILLLIGVPFTWAVGTGSWKAVTDSSWPLRPFASVAALLMTAGAIGFFGTGLAMMGLFNWLPQSAPWPIGFMESVAVTPNGDQIVTHSVGRIQIYDPEWHFKRGWFLESRGGPYKIIKIDNETIEVVANHSRSHWKFDIDGNLISRAKLDDYSRFSAIDEWQFTPATWWLLPIASPWLGFGSLAIGACSLRVANRVATLVRRRNRGSRGHF